MLTLPEIIERLKRLEETYLLEVLNIDSEMIVERFSDVIEEMADKLEKEVQYDGE